MHRRGEKIAFVAELVNDEEIGSTQYLSTFFVNEKRYCINGTSSEKFKQLNAFKNIKGKIFNVFCEVKANYNGSEYNPEMCVIDVHFIYNHELKYDLRFDI